MKSKILGLLAVGLLAGPMAAHATSVTFNFDSTVTLNDPAGGSGFDPVVALGNPLSISVTFDSAAGLIRTRNDGNGNPTVFDFNPSSISVTLSAGGLTETNAFNASGGGLMRVRDNAKNPDCGSGNALTDFCAIVDGITFGINSPDGLTSWTLILRGTTLDLITGAAVPTYQDDRWDNQQIAQFAICQSSAGQGPGSCDLGQLVSTVRAVPEPGTLALLGLGLAGLGLSRRRKA
jgi:hypothetical protein